MIDCNLTMLLAYSAQPLLLDAHLNHLGVKQGKANHQTLPQDCVYKNVDGTRFVFRPQSLLHSQLQKAKFSNNDDYGVWSTQQIIQTAISDMTIPEIEKEYGPVQVVQKMPMLPKPQGAAEDAWQIV